MTDPRRHIPRTDALLALAQDTPLAAHALKSLARTTQDACRRRLIPPHAAEAYFLALVGKGVASMTPVLNATGVVVHTNVGRAALAPEAVDALVDAAGYVDVEMDLATGRRSRNRGAGARDALLAACPAAEDALVVNNGAGALVVVRVRPIRCAHLDELDAGRLDELRQAEPRPDLDELAPRDEHAAVLRQRRVG